MPPRTTKTYDLGLLPMTSPEESPPQARVRARFPELYRQLCAQAHKALRRWRLPSLESADLVHDVYLRFVQEEKRRAHDGRSALGDQPDHAFKACFGAACRDILASLLRRRILRLRHLDSIQVPLPSGPSFDFLDLDAALVWLAERSPAAADLVEARAFGDLSFAECAALFGEAETTLRRRYGVALARLQQRLAGDDEA